MGLKEILGGNFRKWCRILAWLFGVPAVQDATLLSVSQMIMHIRLASRFIKIYRSYYERICGFLLSESLHTIFQITAHRCHQKFLQLGVNLNE